MRVVTVTFHPYNRVEPSLSYLNQFHFDRLCKTLHNYKTVDRFVFVDNNVGLDTSEITDKRVEVYFRDRMESPINNQDFGIDKCNSGDEFIIMDPDLMIYDYNYIEGLFDRLKDFDVLANFDGGCRDGWSAGLLNLKTLDENPFRERLYHIAPCLCVTTKDFYDLYRHVDGLDDRNSLATFEEFTYGISQRCPNPRIEELLDWRNNISIWDDLKIVKWGIRDLRCDYDSFITAPYYHIRNSGDAILTILAQTKENWDYPCSIVQTPTEGLRILAWFVVLTEGTKYQTDITSILERYKIPIELWDEYLKEFKLFHRTHLIL